MIDVPIKNSRLRWFFYSLITVKHNSPYNGKAYSQLVYIRPLCMDSLMWSRMMYQELPHFWAAFRCILYSFSFSFAFFIYRNLISSLRRMVWILFCVTSEAGDVTGTLILA
jgi:hypothetical protein